MGWLAGIGRTWLPAISLIACGAASSAKDAGTSPGADASTDAVDDAPLDAASTPDTEQPEAPDAAPEAAADARPDAPPHDAGADGPRPRDAAPEAAADARDDADAGGEGGIPPLVCPNEMWEPNDTQVTATQLPAIDDCDSSGSSLTGVASGMGDTDWMHFYGTDSVLCLVDPTVQIDAPGLRVCLFVICPEGVTTIESCGIGTPDTSPAETPGCCTDTTSSMTVQISCGTTGTDDSADVYIRVDQPNGNQCVPYDVSYHF